MVQQKKNILTSGLYFLYSVAILFLESCNGNTKTLEEMKPYEGPMMEVDSMETIYTENAEMRVKLIAANQIELQNGNREFPKGIYVEFYEGKEISSVLTANFAKYFKETGKYKVSGNVVINNSKEEKKLATEEMFWFPDQEKILVENDKQVVITTKTDVLHGKGLEANQDFSQYKILHPSGETTIK